MSSNFPHQSEPRQRRYPFLSLCDFALQLLLGAGVLGFACLLMGVILMNNAPRILAQVSYVVSQILR